MEKEFNVSTTPVSDLPHEAEIDRQLALLKPQKWEPVAHIFGYCLMITVLGVLHPNAFSQPVLVIVILLIVGEGVSSLRRSIKTNRRVDLIRELLDRSLKS